MRYHKCSDTDTPSGQKRDLGGALTELNTVSVTGQLDQLEILPADTEIIRSQFWNGKYVSIKLADRMAWLTPEETIIAIEMLQNALKAATQNAQVALPD